MKKLILFCIAALLFTSCNDDDYIIWDFVNPSIVFTVTDADGNDLLDPTYEHNIIGNGITVTYRENEYTYGPPSRATLPLSIGLRSYYLETSDKWILAFGEFSPTMNYRGEKFTIDWGDGTKDEVEFDLYITWNGNDPTVHRNISLNEEHISSSSLHLELEKEPGASGIVAMDLEYQQLPQSFLWNKLPGDFLIIGTEDDMAVYFSDGKVPSGFDFEKYDYLLFKVKVTDMWVDGFDPMLYLYPDGEYVFHLSVYGYKEDRDIASSLGGCYRVDKLPEDTEVSFVLEKK